MSTLVANIQKLPKPLQKPAISKLFGFLVKFFGTANIQVESINQHQAVMVIKNKTKVQNHIGSVHAAAMALLAESVTGLLFGMSVPDDKLPLIKEMNLKYVKRATGDMKAVATLTDEQIAEIQVNDKGDMKVDVVVTDANGVEPVICEMVWAWVPKKKKAS